MKKGVLIYTALLLAGTAIANEQKPVLLDCPLPLMPVKARALNISGAVEYQAWVNAKGEVYSMSLKGDEVFFKEVDRAVKRCKFEPGKPGVHHGKMSFIIPKEGEAK
ncbi:energy transducer TonB [Yokenella regensburgei]|uniref:energy transducer TonB n=1 Tax=Yokenella regensburgei TaxID=158877 RepID=UPI003F147C88